ncbi:hypothetical protein [Streptomyces griseoaurantiacus]|uniref:hypothetical protein n=1 Tax=Streptomyces griseoaurantiacus TaxID=68213 RepID=UPI00362A6E99
MTAPSRRTTRSGADLRILRAAVFTAVCVVLAAVGHGLASRAPVPPWTLGAGFLAVFALALPLAGRERSLPGIAALLAVGQAALHTLFGLGGHGTGTAMAGMRGMAGMNGMNGMAGMLGGHGPAAGAPGTVSGTLAHGASAADADLVARAARLLCGGSTASITPAEAHRLLTAARIDTTTTGAAHHPADALATATAGCSSPLFGILPSLPMLLGHVLAAVVAGWVLRRGDLALLRLMRLSAYGVAGGAPGRALRTALAYVRALLAGLPGAPGRGPVVPCGDLTVPSPPRTALLQHSVIRRGPPATGVLVLAA